jgi:hypothetical protein
MAAGTWIKEHARLGDGEGRGPGALYVEDSAAQQVEMSGGFSGMVPGDAAESPGVEDASASPHTAMQSGAGLGLSITKLIVDRSEGEVFFEDRASNQGASCCIILPVEASN